MVDHTRRDVRVGDLSAINAVEPDAVEPRLGETTVDATRTRLNTGIAQRPMAPAGRVYRMPSPVTLVLVGLIVILAGVVAFLAVQQRALAQSLAMLEASAKESVATLETRVASTNTTLKSADGETQKSLNLIASDIARIDANMGRVVRQLTEESKAREAVAADLQSLAAEQRKTAQAAAQAAAQGDAQLEARLKSLADTVDQLAARQKAQADGLSRLERSGDAAQLRSEVAVLGASFRDMQDEHEKRLKATEQAIGSNDAFRRQVNATIDRLNQQVAELYQRR